MPRTTRADRLQAILDLLQVEHSIPTDELAHRLGVSLVTIRRDLKQLQESGTLVNGYGFVQKVEASPGQDSRFSRRLSTNRTEKQKLAQAALAFVQEGDVLFLDESTTCYVLAETLVAHFSNLHIITNAVHTLLALSQAQRFTVESTGGSLLYEFNSLIGPRAESMLRQMYANKFFFSCRAFRQHVGTYELSPFSASVKRIMLENSEQNFLLVDHSKIGITSPFPFARMEEIQTMIVDREVEGLPHDEIKKVIVAK
ncbi:MAG TPA: DeoR/GlpR family DNA-binding transcription regulator [Thermotogota bacterium]|nr:DeoR/GlpR family DNA-binding transcription regulator [Thermotogota bacterium]HRW92944.1 DeoR/GlpR family DNA-binding transcription regulator [Thermotogota bacterium]